MSVVIPGSENSADEQPSVRGLSSVTATNGRGTDLAVWTDQSANRCVLNLRGRLCADTVGVLDRHVDRLGCRWCDEVVVDLGSLVVMDDVGARLLVGLGHYVAGRGGRLDLRRASSEVAAMIAAAEVELEA